ncbi:MAG: glycosyltransferase [Candidatus Omnitrophica bacterium]|nr:glycosyltransferase [Candidatus Omnitrophota bacterium]
MTQLTQRPSPLGMTPKVSVVVPTYNRAHLIPEALESIWAQTYRDLEVIVVDDGSTDDTREILRPWWPRLRYIYQPNQGCAAARNRGISLARGTYVAFLDSDDRWLPDKLAQQVAWLEAHSKAGLVYSRLWRYVLGRDAEREICPRELPATFLDVLRGSGFIPTSTVMVRRRCLEAVGLFDVSLPVAEDWDLWLRIARRYPIAALPAVLAEHREHATNITKDLAKVYEGYWRFYAKAVRLYATAAGAETARFRDRAISFRYLLGTTYLKRGQMREAVRQIAGALQARWSIGTYFARQRSWVTTLACLLKPYGALTVSLLGALGSLVIPSWRSR